MARLAVENLVKRFGALEAVKGVSLALEPGRSLALIGPTAAGKSVLLKCLAGLYAPEEGRILVDRAEVGVTDSRPSELNARIGMLFQQNALFDSLPVWENIAFRLIANGMARDEARAKAEALLPRVGLPAANADLFPADLSGGMQKRVGFARAIATEPDILLLDNPTAGLDPILAARVDGMISDLARESGACVISATGNMVGITEAYDEIAVMHDGVLRWHGAANEAATADNAWLRQLLDGSRDGPISTLTSAA
ncbi:MAG: ATP-binding cassette domain-containing protein [Alphaproteobacteria bacterium]|nr:ATP-binding cassette domain-containing protein [Alphaproteobacteria bacterium]